MIHVLAAIVIAWLMFNAALYLLLDHDQRVELFCEVIDRFKRAIGAR